MTIPANIPEKGFYRHYKHTNADLTNYTYKLIGIAINTEDEKHTVIYKPLYKSSFLGELDFMARPLEMFMETVEVSGETIQRFTKITDPEIIAELEKLES